MPRESSRIRVLVANPRESSRILANPCELDPRIRVSVANSRESVANPCESVRESSRIRCESAANPRESAAYLRMGTVTPGLKQSEHREEIRRQSEVIADTSDRMYRVVKYRCIMYLPCSLMYRGKDVLKKNVYRLCTGFCPYTDV